MINDSNQNASDSNKISVKEITLPKGGGAIHGIGDSFKANLFSGAGTYSIPVPVTKARGFEPILSINYSSGTGNGIFGLGFSLSLSSISIRTSNGIPRYDGTDTYQLDGDALVAQESSTTVPNPRKDTYEGQDCQVTLYLPRIESAFSQIEHWQNDQGLSFWIVITADNSALYYGTSTTIANPDDPAQIYQWLIDFSIDNKGNQIVYSYLSENTVNVPETIYELNRSNTANRYIHTVQYGNYTDAKGNMGFAFELVFNYGQATDGGWFCRNDPFSSYNSGFEIRTYRLCQNIQLVHHFPEELGDAVIVKELGFNYEDIQQYTPVVFQGMSMLTKVMLTGFRKELSEPQAAPPLEFGYSAFQPPTTPEFNVLSMGDDTIPGYLNATQFLPVDLNGDGLPGFLLSNDVTSLYLEPLGDGTYRTPANNTSFPIAKNVQDSEATLTDLDGNGQLELLVNSPDTYGFYARTFDGLWNNFVPFKYYPTAFSDAHMEMMDLAGNGKSDLLLASPGNLLYYPSLGKEGYSSAHDVPGESDFPLIKQGYPQELVCFSNMFGDGLSHRVRITNCSVECWPSLGYGHFGKKVTFANAPRFGEAFNAGQLFLADIDGSGTTDLAYVYADRVELFLNQSGNSFSDAIVIYLPAIFDKTDQINFSDILGNGTACLVFTKISPEPRHYYYNFSGELTQPCGSYKSSLKPYLLNKIDNNMGLVSYTNYCSSTKFILEDKLAGRPWVTKLPFPVQVVEEITVHEKLSGSRYVSRYKYHDGYFDPDQKQFLGFGFTESWDTESYETFQDSYSNPDYPVQSLNKDLFVPPVYTKTWYLNGVPTLEYEQLLEKYKSDYFNLDTAAYDFPHSRFSPDIYSSSTKTLAEAYNALQSQVMRREVYALDETAYSSSPYLVEDSNYTVVLVQEATAEKYAVFMTTLRESITYRYERNCTDPRTEQHFVLQTDLLCNQPLIYCKVCLPRRGSLSPDFPEQYSSKGIITVNNFYNSPASDVHLRLRGVRYQEQGFELLNLENPVSGYFSFENIDNIVQMALQDPIPYMATPSGKVEAQQFKKERSYFSDGHNQVMPFGEVSPQVLLHHISTAEFTNDAIAILFGKRLTQDTIQTLGGFVYDTESGYWENRGLIQLYSEAKDFYLPSGTSSALGTMSSIDYDSYLLSPVMTTDYISISPPVSNVVTVEMDYQAMAPKQMMDINGNVSQALFDALGQVIVTSQFGLVNGVETGAMRLYDYDGKPAEYQLRTIAPDGGQIDFDSVIKDDTNKAYYLQGALNYYYYDLNAFAFRNQPACSVYLQGRNYFTNPGGSNTFLCETAVTYNDGLGRTLSVKVEVEPVNAVSCWLVSGRSVYNNKGKVFESYLPYFSETPLYQTQDEITGLYKPQPPLITRYDPLLRIIRIDTPKGFFSKIEFSAWEQSHFDEDDTVTDSVYYRNFMAGYPATPTQEQIDEKKALEMAATFYNTPITVVIDNVGRKIRSIQVLKNNQETSQLTSWYAEDIQGRKSMEIDARLYADNQSKGMGYYNFRYCYNMSDDSPMVTDSADAGIQRHFSNIFGKQIWSLSPRDYCQVIYYDGLQRKTMLLVKKVPGSDPIIGFDSFNLVEEFTYGEYAENASGYNLRGQIHVAKDLSGIASYALYSMLGSALSINRQMTSAYKSAIDWHNDVPLETNLCEKVCTYDALNLLLSETVKDNGKTWASTVNTYNREGLINSVTLSSGGIDTKIIRNITYDANRQRTKVVYGNGVQASYAYEPSTQHLLRIRSLSGTMPPLTTVQDIAYTYDPVGNITCSRDSSIDTVFNNNQKVDPVSEYQYDSLYRLSQAKGRQHPGISSASYKNNTIDGSFMQSLYSQSPLNDAQAIENYTENYFYDHSGNLTKKQHTAVSSSWTFETAVLENCNRLQGLSYDESGNQRQLAINNIVSLGYNCCENLISAAVIERPGESDDSDYYVYEFTEQRTRKVCERYVNDSSVNYSDTIYYGNYEVLHKGTEAKDGTRTVTINRQTLRIMDGNTCVAVLYHWLEGGPDSTKDKPAPDQLRYQLGNSQDSVAVELDERGQLVSYEEYFPYGGTSFIAGPKQVEVAMKTYRYSGKECDDSTGLYYYGMRYYVSWLGRWLKPDPEGTVDGLNLYAFVGGNPISYVDPTGLALTKKEENVEQRKEIYQVSVFSASWKKQKLTVSSLLIATWNTQDKHGRALNAFKLTRGVPDVLLVQEAGAAPWGGIYNAHTGVTNGKTTVARSQYGTNDTFSQTVYFAHVDTGSKNLMILSALPIYNSHLIDVTGQHSKDAWRFRPAMAAQIGGVNFVNIHLVSGAQKLAAKHLGNLIENVESTRPTFVGGDANMDGSLFDEVAEEAEVDVDVESFSAEESTHKGGGSLDHALIMGGTDDMEVTATTTHAKGSDHKMRLYRSMW